MFFKELKKLVEEQKLIIEDKDKEIERLKKQMINPLNCLKEIMGRDIKWVDFNSMSSNDKTAFYQSAQDALKNEAIRSIVGYTDNNEVINGEAIKDLMLYISQEAPDWETIQFFRGKLAGVDMIREYLEKIPNPNLEKAD